MSNLFNLKNPIQRSIVDKEQLRNLFKKYGIIPYYGFEAQTSHSTLDLFQNLTALSGSFTSAINDISQYSFGRNLIVAPRMIGGIFVDESERANLEYSQQLEYSLLLKSLGISLANVGGWSRKILRYLKDSGNAYLHLKRVTVGDTRQYSINVYHYRQVAYLESKDSGNDFLIYTKIWDEQYWVKNPPTIVRATQMNSTINWDKTGEGIEEAIIHLKTNSGNDPSDFYSRPDITSILSWLYVDIEVGTLNGKIAATEIITKKILAFEAPDPNTLPPDDEEEVIYSDTASETTNVAASGEFVQLKKKLDYFERNMRELRTLTTNFGDYNKASSIGGIEFPFGQKAPIPIDIEVNRDTAHHAWQCETAVSQICSNLQWNAALTGLKEVKSGLGGNIIRELFIMRNETTIIPIQETMSTVFNNVFFQILAEENAPKEFLTYGIQFPDIVQRLVDKLSNNKNETVSVKETVEEI